MSSRKTEALSPPPEEDTLRIDFDSTIECLLALRSVRDQFADAELDSSLGELADKLVSLEKSLIDYLAEQREHQDGLGLLTVSVIGDFNSGKSTFINALLGTDMCPVGDEPTTASVTYFVHGDQERIEQVSEDETRVLLNKTKYHALASHKKEGDSEPRTFRISINSPVLDHIRLVDTPGFNAPPPNTKDTRVTEKAVMESDVLFVLSDANKGNPADTLLNQLSRLSQNSTNQPMFVLLNKAEDLPPSQRREVKHFCKENHGDLFRDVVLVSALQLNEAEDEEPLDALDSAMQRMRSAYKARDSFQENISAKLTEHEQSYHIDISGNVYDVPVASDFELASREQLTDMVKEIAAERHSLLEQQFKSHTLQLRKNLQTIFSELDLVLKRELSDSSSDSHNETKLDNALKAIEKAEIDALDCIREIYKTIAHEIVKKDQRIEDGFWSDTYYYQVRVFLGKESDIMDAHDAWTHIFNIYQNLFSNIERSFDTINLDHTPQGFFEDLKKFFLRDLRKNVQGFQRYMGWHEKKKSHQYEFKNGEYGRDEFFDSLISRFESAGEYINLSITDDLKEAVTRATERNKSKVTRKAEEIEKIQERINKMKEYSL